ncbi:MAG TPA: hypothetical protein VHY08_26070 [Bacillota bacterium]|nr:hypothetical protein [Bacillota bacterium]
MRGQLKWLILGFSGILLLLFAVPALAQPENSGDVQSVEVQLRTTSTIYEGLQERIEYSIGRVGEKILLGRPLSLLREEQDAVKSAIFNVFSKALAGFKIDQIDLVVDTHTKVIIELTPIPPLITDIRLNLEVEDLAPEIIDFSKEITAKVETELNRVFVGLPVASISWAEGIFNLVGDYLLARELPGFQSDFSIKAGERTEFSVKLIPQEPRVSEVKVKYKATGIPVWLLIFKAKQYQDQFNLLKGIPVEFLIHYQARLEEYLTEYCNDFSQIKRSGMRVDLGIKPGAKTLIQIGVASEIYRVKFEARYLMLNEGSYGNFQVNLGYRTENYELLTRWSALGDDPYGNLRLGLNFPIAPNMTGGIEYDFEHYYKNLNFHFEFERGDYLDLKLGLEQSPTEAIVGIYLNDFVNLEMVDLLKQKNTLGVRLILHF